MVHIQSTFGKHSMVTGELHIVHLMYQQPQKEGTGKKNRYIQVFNL